LYTLYAWFINVHMQRLNRSQTWGEMHFRRAWKRYLHYEEIRFACVSWYHG